MVRFGALVLALTTAAALLVGIPRTADAEPVPGDGDVTPLQVTGDPKDKLNLIVLGDGYTADELDDFHADVDKHLNVLWSLEPFRSYRNYVNVYRVDVVSNESGVSCDPDDGNARRDTALHLEYAEECPADPNARGITFGEGGEEALETYVDDIPGVTAENRQTLTLANTDTYGGIGGRNATTSGGNSLGPLITPHELGHSLGGLQDEYPYSERGVPGPAYTDGEPDSVHHTLLTIKQMRQQHKKWWRWLGEKSLSGGKIGRYESGMTSCCDIWRPSRHSMMRWVGYFFDQPSREIMIRQISGRRDLQKMAIGAPKAGDVGRKDVLWVETPHPTYHDMQVSWQLNGRRIESADGARNLSLSDLKVRRGDKVRVEVHDPTPFIRDPAIEKSPAMTASRTWTVGQPLPADNTLPAFTTSTQTDRPVGGKDVVFVETTHPAKQVLNVSWRLDGKRLRPEGDGRTVDLAALDLSTGTHELRATLSDPFGEGVAERLKWTIDNTPPTVEATFSKPLLGLSIPTLPAQQVYEREFTMGLEPADDHEGYVVAEFRLDGDGWHNFYGWPDAPEGAPFHFTPKGTKIKELIYGALSPGGVSWAPFEKRKPGYGEHTVEYRAIDAAGNISKSDSVNVMVMRKGSETAGAGS